MLETIFSGLTNAIASALDFILEIFLVKLGFDVTSITKYISFLPDLYRILQAVGLGLVIAIAIFQLSKFLAGNMADTQDRPEQIGARVIIAVALIYWGNYILQLVFDLCSYPMAIFYNVDSTLQKGIAVGQVDTLTKTIQTADNLAGLGIAVLTLVMVITLCVSLLKLLIEAVERWLVLCLITYTSPLVYATVTSRITSDVFKRWVSMIIGQCILLWANVWMVKALISILASASTGVSAQIFSIVLIFALSRVAQRIDSYLQQLGIGAATTGSLLDALTNSGAALTGIGTGKSRGKSGSPGGVLGAYTKSMGNAIKEGNIAKGAMLGGVWGAGAAGGNKLRKFLGKKAGDGIRKMGEKAAATGAELEGKQFADTADKLKSVAQHPIASAYNTVMRQPQSKDALRDKAISAGLDAARVAMTTGKTAEEAKLAAITGFGDFIKKNKGAPIIDPTGHQHEANAAARQSFAEQLDEQIPQMYNDYDKQQRAVAMTSAENALANGNDENAINQGMAAYSSAYGGNLSDEKAKAFNEQLSKHIATSKASSTMEAALRKGAAVDQAVAEGMRGYDNIYSQSANPPTAEARAAFQQQLTSEAQAKQNGASRYRISSDGTIRNGYGDIVEEPMDDASNETLARMYAFSADQSNGDSVFGMNDTTEGMIETENGEVMADVSTEGYKQYQSDLNERGSGLADAMIDQSTVVDNDSIATETICASSAADVMAQSDEMKDIGSVMANGGEVQKGNVVHRIRNASIGYGDMSFDHRIDFKDGTEKVERVSIKTEQAFEKMPPKKQAQYSRITSQNGPTYYARVSAATTENIQFADSSKSQKSKNQSKANDYGGSRKNNRKGPRT